jgi:hypothetical protein
MRQKLRVLREANPQVMRNLAPLARLERATRCLEDDSEA